MSCPRLDAARDHPRMCGEHVPYCAMAVSYWGSSPHVRGAQRAREGGPLGPRIIPACAGSTAAVDCDFPGHRDHPRMCGEHSHSET